MASTFRRVARIFGWVLLLSGVLMTYQGCTRAGGALGTWLTGESAEGVVTDIREFRAGTSASRTPARATSVITFRTADDRAVTFEHPVQSLPPPFAKGERVRVHYDPDAPEHAVAPSGLALLTFGWGFVAVAGFALVLTGGLILLIAALPWVANRRTT